MKKRKFLSKRKPVAKPSYQYYDEPPTDKELEKREKKLNKKLGI